MKIFKIDAQGDTVYVRAETKEAAIKRLTDMMGPIPESLLSVSVVKSKPRNEEFL